MVALTETRWKCIYLFISQTGNLMLITVIAVNSTVLYTSNLLDWVDLCSHHRKERGREGGRKEENGNYGNLWLY